MTATFPFVWEHLQNGRLATVILDGAVKGFVLLSVAGVCRLCWRKASAATRHLIWFGAILGALCFPLVSALVPAWQKPLWTVGMRLDSGNQLAVVVGLGPERTHVEPDQVSRSAKLEPSHADGSRRSEGRTLLSAELRLRWINAALAVWSIGFLFVATMLCLDRFRLRGLLLGAHCPPAEAWLA